eukprot:GHVT01100501.1.p3 GENE.GHVT01100501.1~~GHVT01100501.1.p3  ORF type:complete len:204 (-),score=53.04 GHVT01100501.1:3835-4446(-)
MHLQRDPPLADVLFAQLQAQRQQLLQQQNLLQQQQDQHKQGQKLLHSQLLLQQQRLQQQSRAARLAKERKKQKKIEKAESKRSQSCGCCQRTAPPSCPTREIGVMTGLGCSDAAVQACGVSPRHSKTDIGQEEKAFQTATEGDETIEADAEEPPLPDAKENSLLPPSLTTPAPTNAPVEHIKLSAEDIEQLEIFFAHFDLEVR